MDNKKIDLNECREAINTVDEQMAHLFEERMMVVEKIAKYKIENNLPTYDPKREAVIKKKNKRYVSSKYQKYYAKVFDKVLDVSKEFQQEFRNFINDALQGDETASAAYLKFSKELKKVASEMKKDKKNADEFISQEPEIEK